MSSPITKEELAWVILNFNTKRGYSQLRDSSLEISQTSSEKSQEYQNLHVSTVEDLGPNPKRKGDHWFQITYENGAVQTKTSLLPPHKPGDMVDLIITTYYNKDGSIKTNSEGKPMIKLRDPKEDDWNLVKKRTEHLLDSSGKTLGAYIYDHLLQEPSSKIRGQFISTIERKYFREELIAILEKQAEFLPELRDRALLQKCIDELYHGNEHHKQSLYDRNFTHLIADDLIFYQRPLKSKKSDIANCPLEYYTYKDPKTGEKRIQPLKCISKSNPVFQDFRLWQWIRNLKIYAQKRDENGIFNLDKDITAQFLSSPEEISKLFDWLKEKKEITQEQLLRHLIPDKKKDLTAYRWNYDTQKVFPCCPTHYTIVKQLKEVAGQPALNREQEKQLWHILYSVDDLVDLDKALHHFAEKYQIDPDLFARAFIHIPSYPNEYGAYSEKAIKKLLPLMRTGKYWNIDNVDPQTRKRIMSILNGTVDPTISNRTRQACIQLQALENYQYLPVWLASYVVYDRHSESGNLQIWKKPEDIDRYLQENFKPNQLRNPIVTTVLREALKVTKDIWTIYGKIQEIHIEMGRDLKQPNDKRAKDLQKNLENQRINQRIRYLLQEFANPEYQIDSVRPNSPMQQDLLKLYEDNALNGDQNVPDDILDIAKRLGNPTKPVTKTEVMRYRLWLEQGYRSPYTGRTIPLSKLFTTEYQIEHIIPKTRYFDDSLSNKVICESAVNQAKGKLLGYEFILKQGGHTIKGANGQNFQILNSSQYEAFVRLHYTNNKGKMSKLLMADIPDDFIHRQLNDSRYIARKALEIFSPLVREDEDDEETVSKNVIASNGSITDRLKKEWGLNDIWNQMITPRFERMNEITHTQNYGEWVCKEGKRYFQIKLPLDISFGFSKKRIDHRHHAMDAIVIACATRNHINPQIRN